MNNDPKVSVLIKSYNHAPFIGQAIQSVLDQSYQDFEIVITDDFSTDSSVDIIRRFKDPRILLEVSPRNEGIAITMNRCVARARGEYLAILNSDDYALPGRLEKQVKFLDENPDISLLFGMPLPVDDNGRPTNAHNDFTIPYKQPRVSRATWLRHLFFHGNCFCGPAAMIRRSAYDKAGEVNPRYTNLEDHDMWVRMLMSGQNAHVLPDQITAFRIRSGNANMSAPRWDSRLRTQFETAQILRHYRVMEPALLEEMFADDLARRGIAHDGSPETWLVDLALSTGMPSHFWFALQLLFDTANDLEGYNRLRELSGRVDVFGLNAMYLREMEIARLKRVLSEHGLASTETSRNVRNRSA